MVASHSLTRQPRSTCRHERLLWDRRASLPLRLRCCSNPLFLPPARFWLLSVGCFRWNAWYCCWIRRVAILSGTFPSSPEMPKRLSKKYKPYLHSTLNSRYLFSSFVKGSTTPGASSSGALSSSLTSPENTNLSAAIGSGRALLLSKAKQVGLEMDAVHTEDVIFWSCSQDSSNHAVRLCGSV